MKSALSLFAVLLAGTAVSPALGQEPPPVDSPPAEPPSVETPADEQPPPEEEAGPQSDAELAPEDEEYLEEEYGAAIVVTGSRAALPGAVPGPVQPEIQSAPSSPWISSLPSSPLIWSSPAPPMR